MKRFALPLLGFIISASSLSAAMGYPLYNDPLNYQRGERYDRNYYYQDGYNTPSQYYYSDSQYPSSQGYYYSNTNQYPSSQSYYYSDSNSNQYPSSQGYYYSSSNQFPSQRYNYSTGYSSNRSVEDNLFYNSSTPGYDANGQPTSQGFYEMQPSDRSNAQFYSEGQNADMNRNVDARQATAGNTDIELANRIRRAIQNEPGLSANAQNINIDAQQGQVTLQGTVTSDAEKSRVENLIKQINGVKNINNRLSVASNR